MTLSVSPRSLAIRLVALAQLVLSGLSLLSGGILVLLMTGQIQLYSADLSGLEPYYKGLILSGVAISLIGVISAWGLGQQRRWGWLGSVIFQGLCLFNNALAVIAGQPPSVGTYVSAIICTGMFALLCLPQIRQPCFELVANRQKVDPS